MTNNNNSKNHNRLKIDYCIYGCGKKIFWNPNLKIPNIKFQEFDTGKLHDYPRCAELLKEQGKDVGVLKKK